MKRRLLVISYRFPPETYPLAIRLKYFLRHLQDDWTIDAVTAAPEAESRDGLTVHHVPSRTPERLLDALRTLRLDKLIDVLAWPDRFLFWVLPALREARRLVREKRPDAVAVFMMPYSTGLVGVALKKMTGLPLVFNLNDSLTCSDMNPFFPSRLHYGLARRLEDLYARTADATVYVSRRNMERVRERQPPECQDRFHLIRRGVALPEASERPTGAPEGGKTPEATPPVADERVFRIVYVGAMSGWYAFPLPEQGSAVRARLKQFYRAWMNAGRYRLVRRDERTHSPAFIGQAIQRVLAARPEWAGRVALHVYGPFPSRAQVDRVLRHFGLDDVVVMHGAVPHDEALRQERAADLLFMALPDRPDGSAGGRISAKTYEYLATDRPILAALPRGENRDYLQGKPGVHLAGARDVDAMTAVVERLAGRWFAGGDLQADRSALRPHLRGEARARRFEEVLRAVLP